MPNACKMSSWIITAVSLDISNRYFMFKHMYIYFIFIRDDSTNKTEQKKTRWKNSSAKYKAECLSKSSMKCLKFDNSFYQLWSKWLETFMFERGVWQTDEFDSHLLKVQTSKVSKKKQQHKHLEQSFDIPINLQFFFYWLRFIVVLFMNHLKHIYPDCVFLYGSAKMSLKQT